MYTPKVILSEWLHKTNKYDSSKNALVFMGVLVTAIVLLTNILPSVNLMYQALILILQYFILSLTLYLVVVYIKLIDSAYKYLLGFFVFISTSLGIILSFQPSIDLTGGYDIFIYEFELILEPTIFIFIGWLLYKFK